MAFSSRQGRLVSDSTPPNTPSITTPATTPSYSYNGAISYSGTVSDAAPDTGITMIQYSLDGNNWINISGFTPIASGSGNWTMTFNGLAVGSHTFAFRSENGAGLYSTATATQTFIYDNTAPTVVIGSPADGFTINTSSVIISGTSSDPQSGVSYVQYQLNGGSWTICSGTTSWSATVTGLSLGTNTINVRATNNAGTTSTPVTITGDYQDSATLALLHVNSNLTDSAYGSAYTSKWSSWVAGITYPAGKFSTSAFCDASTNQTPFLYNAGATLWSLGTGNWTVDFWIYNANMAGSAGMYGFHNGSAVVQDGLEVENTGGTWNAWMGGSIQTWTGVTGLNANAWNHIAFVKNSTTTALLFINGVSKGSKTWAGGTFAPVYATVGGIINGGFMSYVCNTNIDEFRLSSGARWTSNFSVPTAPW